MGTDDLTGWAQPERGVLPGDGPGPERVEPETGVEPDEEAAEQRAETWGPPEGVGTQGGKDVGPAPSGA